MRGADVVRTRDAPSNLFHPDTMLISGLWFVWLILSTAPISAANCKSEGPFFLYRQKFCLLGRKIFKTTSKYNIKNVPHCPEMKTTVLWYTTLVSFLMLSILDEQKLIQCFAFYSIFDLLLIVIIVFMLTAIVFPEFFGRTSFQTIGRCQMYWLVWFMVFKKTLLSSR